RTTGRDAAARPAQRLLRVGGAGAARATESSRGRLSSTVQRMRILVLGGDGYLGWSTAMYFSQLGHDIMVVDSLAKRQWEAEVDGAPLEPVPTLQHRARLWSDVTGKEIAVAIGDIAENH